MPVLSGEADQRGKDLFFGYRRLFQGTDGAAIISGDWKLLREAKKDGATRMFNLKDDPYEQNDLYSSQREQADELHKKLEELDASCQLSRDGADYRY